MSLHISKHTGKMKGIMSLNTNSLTNPYCIAHRDIAGSVCEKCYAKSYLSYRKSLTAHCEKNGRLLSSGVLPMNELPLLNELYFRFESFGDLINETHFINLCRICEKNPLTTFALWTKNPFIIERVFATRRKPDNLIINLSSIYLNKKAECPYPWVDHIFTVYSKNAVKEGTRINCGGKKCLECLNCYKADSDFFINEILK